MRKSRTASMKSYHRPGLLQVLPALQSGGVERGTIDIAAASSNAGFRSFVTSEGGAMVPQLYQGNTKHFTLPLNNKNPIEIYRNSKRLAKLIRENNIHILHARSRAPAWSAYFAAKETDCKFVTTFHGIYHINNALKHYYNSIMTKGEKVIAVSEFTAAHILENYTIDESRLVTIQRGADMETFNPENISQQRIVQQAARLCIPTDKRIIMMPARISKWKGHMFLLEALQALPREQFYCLFLGDDKGHMEYRRRIEKQIAEYGLQDNVGIAGNTKDMAAAYMLADVIVSASIEPEAFGRVAIEAQAMGRPLVATAIGGSCETVVDGKTGWLVPPLDTAAMTQALRTALSLNEEERLQMGKVSRQHIQDHFSLDGMCSKTIELYHGLLEEE